MKGRIHESVAGLFPGSFALVMATGIVSFACDLLGMRPLADVLFGLNVAFYAVLWLLSLGGLLDVAHVLGVVALAAWLVVFVGLLRQLRRTLRPPRLA